MEYTIHKQTEKTAEVLFVDPESGSTHTRTRNIGDCDTPSKLEERINSHLRAFSHRIAVGAITESSIPVADVPTDIVIPETFSAESKAALGAVIEAKTLELKEVVEKQIADNIKEKRPNVEAEARLAKIQEEQQKSNL